MEGPSPTPRSRGVSLLVARVAAVALSLGVVALVAMNAGLGGCRAAAPGIAAESPAEDPKPGAAPPTASPTAERDDDDAEGFMGGAKAPAGRWAEPPRKRPSKANEQAPNARAAGGEP